MCVLCVHLVDLFERIVEQEIERREGWHCRPVLRAYGEGGGEGTAGSWYAGCMPYSVLNCAAIFGEVISQF